MTRSAVSELPWIFDARRVKSPELRGLDAWVSGGVGWVKNRRSVLGRLRAQAQRVEGMGGRAHELATAGFAEEVQRVRTLARVGKLKGEAWDWAAALTCEAAVRGVGMRPHLVQIMGALAMCEGAIAEMATGEGKTLTAALSASLWAWQGRPVNVITVNDYLVQRDADEMEPVYRILGHAVGHVVHESTHADRRVHYRRNVVYCTSKELVADFLRDQISLGTLRTSVQTSVSLMMGPEAGGYHLMVPGLFRAIVDEADSILVDEAVTPLIISNSPDDNANTEIYRAADELAGKLELGRDFTIDGTLRAAELTGRGERRLDDLAEADKSGFWKGRRRREELVTMALTARHCYVHNEQFLIDDAGKVVIIDESTGRTMADRTWRQGLHQAIEMRQGLKLSSDKEDLARVSFQRFFRQFGHLAGMTGTAWEAAGEIWQIYRLPVVRIPPDRPCVRKQLPTRLFARMEAKWEAVVKRVCELNDRGAPVLVGTRSVLASEEVSRRLKALGRAHRVLNAAQNKEEAMIVAGAGQMGQITVATNMAGRGTDIKLGRGVLDLGGLHVIATEPHASGRVDRQLYGRAARQGDPGTSQLMTSLQDDLFMRHGRGLKPLRRAMGVGALIKAAQFRAERMARFNRRQVLRADDWMDQSLPY